MAQTVILLPRLVLYPRSRNHDSSKQKVKTTDIWTTCSSIKYYFKDDFSSLSILMGANFAKFLTGRFEKVHSPLPKKNN